MRTPVAVVPVKVSSGAKRRLAHELGPRERDVLARALFDHVVGVLTTAGLEVVAVSTAALPGAGVEVWPDRGRGLNAELSAALARLPRPTVVVPADLPWLTGDGIERLLAEPGDVVVARARDGGTAALLLRRSITPAFGPGSALIHARRARRAGLSARVLSIGGLDRDLDDIPGLLAALATSPALRQMRVPGHGGPGTHHSGLRV